MDAHQAQVRAGTMMTMALDHRWTVPILENLTRIGRPARQAEIITAIRDGLARSPDAASVFRPHRQYIATALDEFTEFKIIDRVLIPGQHGPVSAYQTALLGSDMLAVIHAAAPYGIRHWGELTALLRHRLHVPEDQPSPGPPPERE
jgi:hypothetical protein